MVRIDFKNGFIHRGDTRRIKKVMAKALIGEPVTLAFLGGSITQGSLASTDKNTYVYKVYEWWHSTFPDASITCINAGVGGTGSDNAVARVDEHVLKHHPDFVLTEFCVNDCPEDYYKETFESLVRHILRSADRPALMLLNNAHYDDSHNAESVHLPIERHYDVPTVSLKHSVCPLIENGTLKYTDVSPDGLHPNDCGHSLVAELITTALQEIYETVTAGDIRYKATDSLPEPLTPNGFEHSLRLNGRNCSPTLEGFVRDMNPPECLHSIRGNGFLATEPGSFFELETECESLLVQYIKSVKKPAPIAVATVDGDTEHGIVLDANFTEDWGDCLCTVPLLLHGDLRKRKIKITITEGGTDCVPFYLVSVIASKRPKK